MINGKSGYSRTFTNDAYDTLRYVFIDDQMHYLARFPNIDEKLVGFGGGTIVTSAALQGWGRDPVGGFAVMQLNDWDDCTRRIVSFDSTSGQVGLDYSPYGAVDSLILTNSLDLLDTTNEFFYDPAANKLTVIPYNQLSPSANTHAAVYDFGIYIYPDVKFVEINGIAFEHQRIAGILVENKCSSITIENNDFSNLSYAISSPKANWDQSERVRVIDNTITNAFKGGIRLSGSSHSTVSDNVLKNIGPAFGLGEWLEVKNNYYGQVIYVNAATGIQMNGEADTIQYNRLSDLGHYGIAFSDSSIIAYNVIDSCCQLFSDCGALKTYQSVGFRLSNNIIRETFSGNGIYLDYPEQNFPGADPVIVENNVVVRAKRAITELGYQYGHINNNILYDFKSSGLSAGYTFLINTNSNCIWGDTSVSEKNVFVQFADGSNSLPGKVLVHTGGCVNMGFEEELPQFEPGIIYPNPAKSYFKIDEVAIEEGTVELIDLSGRILRNYEWKAGQAYDCSRFSPGLYLIRTRRSQSTRPYKLIIE